MHTHSIKREHENTMSKRDDLVKALDEKKAQLAAVSRGSEGWSSRKMAVPAGARISQVQKQALQKEIKTLSENLKTLDN